MVELSNFIAHEQALNEQARRDYEARTGLDFYTGRPKMTGPTVSPLVSFGVFAGSADLGRSLTDAAAVQAREDSRALAGAASALDFASKRLAEGETAGPGPVATLEHFRDKLGPSGSVRQSVASALAALLVAEQRLRASRGTGETARENRAALPGAVATLRAIASAFRERSAAGGSFAAVANEAARAAAERAAEELRAGNAELVELAREAERKNQQVQTLADAAEAVSAVPEAAATLAGSAAKAATFLAGNPIPVAIAIGAGLYFFTRS